MWENNRFAGNLLRGFQALVVPPDRERRSGVALDREELGRLAVLSKGTSLEHH